MSGLSWSSRKVVIVGAGAVGSTFAYTLCQNGLANEIALMDTNPDFVKGQVMDLLHGQPFFPEVNVHSADKQDYGDAHAIIITAGAKQQAGETRLNLLQRNVSIIKSIMDDILESGSKATIIMVSNPVDILTYVAHKHTGWPRGRIIGSGTVLDSARFRYLLSRYCGIDTHNVHAYILGEHGDSEFAAWSMTHLAGIPIDDYFKKKGKWEDWKTKRQHIEEEVKQSAYHIIGYKGATWFAVGMALMRIVNSILRNEKRVLTVSTPLDGEYGLHDVCLGIPSVVYQHGVESVVETNLPQDESDALQRSSSILKEALTELGY